ncbi:beta-1,3-glucosyltransferase isoform X1 [Drosophila tropicalis]|uniref:beta-1,3-glucosyltransferase isoform X1 n=1 Tax=Drosophila tropicalis TaxID=46794 RepID=UPI0035ABF4B8
MYAKPYYLLSVLWLSLSSSYGGEVLIVITCPPHPQHVHENCFALANSLRTQQQQMELSSGGVPGDYVIKVHIMHELFNYWTLLDSLPNLRIQTRLLNADTEWIIWCQHNTHVSSLAGLLEQLHRQNSQELAYYGHALYDSEATIVHHFAYYKNPTWFPYPMLSAGLVFTGHLLRSLAELVALDAQNVSRHSEFSIDASHELARFVFDNFTPDGEYENDDDDSYNKVQHQQRGDIWKRKIILKSAAYICPAATMASLAPQEMSQERTKRRIKDNMDVGCAMHAKPDMALTMPPPPSTASPVTVTTGNSKNCVHTTGSHIYFAIKTCAKFHKERIPIIERTWAIDAMNRRYYSDMADSGIPTISTGIPNVPTGHCSKTLAILQLSLKDINEQMNMSVRWLMLVDDDTLLSVPRVGALLSCYNHTDNIYVGERYGYRLYAPDGFNYHTGGAGIVFSLPLVRLIVEHCSCPTANAPDDMILGYCLQALGVWAIPGNGLHQARPQDYARELLQQNLPLSFHKFSNTQPEHTYKRWLGGSGGNQSLHHAQLDHNNNNKNKNNGQQATSEHFRDPLQLPIMMAANGKHLDL